MPTPLQPFPLHHTINPTSLSTMTAIEPESRQFFTTPGPSSEPTSPTRASAPSTSPSSYQKRRRQSKDTATDDDWSATTTGPIRNTRAKKKKAARACIHCQRAHLTCDDGVYPLMSIWLIWPTVNVSASLSALYEAWDGGLLHRGSSKTCEIPVG
jgi:hypothetical protein